MDSFRRFIVTKLIEIQIDAALVGSLFLEILEVSASREYNNSSRSGDPMLMHDDFCPFEFTSLFFGERRPNHGVAVDQVSIGFEELPIALL